MLEVLQQFRVLLRSIKLHYQQIEERCGIGGAQLWALAEIAAAPGMQPGELAGRLAIHRSTSSNLLNRPDTLGLIRKERSARDQRVVRLYATRAGKQVLKKAPRPFVGVLQQALTDLPVSELCELQDNLGNVLRLMRLKDPKAAKAMPLAEM